MFSKFFKIKETETEEKKRSVVDSNTLLLQLEMNKQMYAKQRVSKGSNSYARGSVDAYDNMIELIEKMPKYEV